MKWSSNANPWYVIRYKLVYTEELRKTKAFLTMKSKQKFCEIIISRKSDGWWKWEAKSYLFSSNFSSDFQPTFFIEKLISPPTNILARATIQSSFNVHKMHKKLEEKFKFPPGRNDGNSIFRWSVFILVKNFNGFLYYHEIKFLYHQQN